LVVLIVIQAGLVDWRNIGLGNISTTRASGWTTKCPSKILHPRE